ncbi:MAG: S8 family peptidase [Oscillospiraceae bacterium]|nr:S8 family peptidase [Oscillospiraceae bacterium]
MPNDQTDLSNTVALILEQGTFYYASAAISPYIKAKKILTGGYGVVYVNESEIDHVLRVTENYTANIFPHVLGLMGEPDMTASGITQVHRQPYLNLMGSGVLLGFVDTGIDYTMSAFRYEDGSSKVQYIWDQSIEGGAPDGYGYGTEYDNHTINRALYSQTPHDVVPHRDTVGHGTFLASVAASREHGEYIGAAPDAELVVVKLKRAPQFYRTMYLTPPNQENAFSSADVMTGVQYILDKARALGRPVAICIGLGTNTSSHDGGSTLERYLSAVAGVTGTAVCVAAGNEAQAAHHTHDRVMTGEIKDVEMRVNSQEDIYINMWSYAGDRMSVSIKSPTGEIISRVVARPGSSYSQKLILERATIVVDYTFPVGKYGGQFTLIRILSATPGVWTISVYGDSILGGVFHIWLPVTELNPGAVFLTPTPDYTITMPGTADSVVTCGSYDSATGSLSPTSSWGPSRLPTILPNLVAPGVDVGGVFPGGYGRMSGTSVSAAITAGASALLLQWAIVEGNDPSMDTNRLRSDLILGCDRDPNIEYPNNQWGYGRLNLYNTFRMLRPY